MTIVVTFASCGVLRKNKSKQSHKFETVAKRDSVEVSKTTSSGEVKEQTIDKGTILTKRETTTITEKYGKSKVVVKKGELKPGDNFLKNSAGQVVKAVLDTMANTLTFEINTLPERITKTERQTIMENKDQTKQREEKQEQQQEKQVAVTNDQPRSEKSSSAVSNSQPSATGVIGNWIGAAVAVVLVVIGLVWWFFERRNRLRETVKIILTINLPLLSIDIYNSYEIKTLPLKNFENNIYTFCSIDFNVYVLR